GKATANTPLRRLRRLSGPSANSSLLDKLRVAASFSLNIRPWTMVPVRLFRPVYSAGNASARFVDFPWTHILEWRLHAGVSAPPGSDHFALPRPRKVGRRGNGRRLQSRGLTPTSDCRSEVPAAGHRSGSRRARTLSS